MLGQSTIEEKYKQSMKDTLFILSKCNKILALKNQLLLSGPDVARTFRSPLKLDLDDKNKSKQTKRQGAHSHMLPRGSWPVLDQTGAGVSAVSCDREQ